MKKDYNGVGLPGKRLHEVEFVRDFGGGWLIERFGRRKSFIASVSEDGLVGGKWVKG